MIGTVLTLLTLWIIAILQWHEIKQLRKRIVALETKDDPK